MLRIVGIMHMLGAKNFVLMDSFGNFSYMNADTLRQLILNGFDVSNAAIKDSQVITTDIPVDKLPQYSSSGKYLGSQPVFTIVDFNKHSGKYRLVTNNLTIEEADPVKVRAILNSNPDYICNARLINNQISVAEGIKSEPKPVADLAPVNSSNKPFLNILMFGEGLSENFGTETKVVSRQDSAAFINNISALGDLFIDNNGVGAWAYNSCIVYTSIYASDTAVICGSIAIAGDFDYINGIEEVNERNFKSAAVNNLSNINYNAFIKELMSDTGKEYYSFEDIQHEVLELLPKISGAVVRLGNNGISGPIVVEDTLKNFEADEKLNRLRKAGLSS